MQGNVQKQIRNAGLFAGASPNPAPVASGPNKYTGKQFEYFELPTSAHIWENAQYASNYFKAQVQGIIPGTFETERGAYIRCMDIVEQTTGAKMPNDYQSIYFQDTRIKGLYTGAKVKFAGNTWLAISPFNISDPMSSSVIRRCNAIWKHLDYYGNVLCEPFIFQDARAQSTANEYLDYSVIPNWYQKCVMQMNEQTKELAYNRRIVLGSSVVEVRGLVDFITDFSGTNPEGTENPEPTHVIFFDAQYQEPNLAIDDMERGIAGGKAFSWVLLPSFSAEMGASSTQQIVVNSLRNNEAPDTDNHPVTYLFSSSDTSVLTVDMEGNVESVGEGKATITITLQQNPEIQTEIEITVSEEQPAMQFVFTPELPDKLKQMQTYTGTVSIMQGGSAVATPISMTAYGATEQADVELLAGNAVTIRSYEASEIPLSIVFRADAYGLVYTKNIQLEGY